MHLGSKSKQEARIKDLTQLVSNFNLFIPVLEKYFSNYVHSMKQKRKYGGNDRKRTMVRGKGRHNEDEISREEEKREEKISREEENIGGKAR